MDIKSSVSLSSLTKIHSSLTLLRKINSRLIRCTTKIIAQTIQLLEENEKYLIMG